MRRRWALTAGLAILILSVLIAVHWPILPLFLDYFYHLAVVEGFRQSGGPVLHDWWEFAPDGRPHLYPPLWHLATLPFLKLGLDPLTTARFWCVIVFPLVAFTFWRVVERLFDARSATWVLLLLATPYSLTLAILNYPTASLASLLGLLAWLAIERKQIPAASIALGLMGYTHTGLFWLFLLSLAIYLALRRETRRTTGISLAAGIFLASPWLVHQLIRAGTFHLAVRKEAAFLEWAPALLALGAWGAIRSCSASGPVRFGIAWWLGTLPMAIHYRFRLFAGHGLLPTVFLAGLGAADLWRRGLAWRILLVTALFLWPAWHRDLSGQGLRWFDHSLAALAGWQEGIRRATDQPLHFKKFWEPIAKSIETHSGPEELFACNLDYAAGILSVLSRRATTVGMLGEVTAPATQDPIRNARILVWIKEKPLSRPPRELEEIVLKHHLQPLAETEIAYLYRNPWATGRRKVARAILPWWLAELLILGALAFLARALYWRRS